jgi:hypothetical protein
LDEEQVATVVPAIDMGICRSAALRALGENILGMHRARGIHSIKQNEKFNVFDAVHLKYQLV